MMATKRSSSALRAVLPEVTSKAGGKKISSVEQLLTVKQRKVLRSDLTEMAKRRREAEAASGNLRLS